MQMENFNTLRRALQCEFKDQRRKMRQRNRDEASGGGMYEGRFAQGRCITTIKEDCLHHVSTYCRLLGIVPEVKHCSPNPWSTDG